MIDRMYVDADEDACRLRLPPLTAEGVADVIVALLPWMGDGVVIESTQMSDDVAAFFPKARQV